MTERDKDTDNILNHINPKSMKYFFGRILREEADCILKKNGLINGSFLLRESVEESGVYILSINLNDSINHYKIDRKSDGTFITCLYPKSFIGPIELINYCQIYKVINQSIIIPCERPKNTEPIYFALIDNDKLNNLVENEIDREFASKRKHLSGDSYERSLREARNQYRYIYEKKILKDLHLTQTWFLVINREQADQILCKPFFASGTFLVRSDDNGGSYRVSVKEEVVKHYIMITKVIDGQTKYSMKDSSHNFDSLFQLIDYHHRLTEGTTFKLEFPYQSNDLNDRASLDLSPKIRIKDKYVIEYQVECNKNILLINQKYLIECGIIFTGTFTTVYHGIYKTRDNDGHISKEEQVTIVKKSNNLYDTFKEIELLLSFSHPNIIKFIGLSYCKENKMYLILEYCKGRLKNYVIQKKESVSIIKIMNFCIQIALAMEYLASLKLVYRNLSSQNVWIFKDESIKLGDFSFTRDVTSGSFFETITEVLPFRWMSPETIRFGVFNEKTDIWSYGITVWEATNFGLTPYQDLKDEEILENLENNKRLERPHLCPDEVFELIQKCWSYENFKRPNFKMVVIDIQNIIEKLYYRNTRYFFT